MPTYEYECKMCGHTFDVFQSMSDTPLKTCPKCGKELRRLINGGSGIIFKGSGFYVTDKSGKNASEPAKPKPDDKPVVAESSAPSVAKSDTPVSDKAEKVAG
ncbi:MAG: zinc ribbon domain-containing protein [Treponema sp.]|jgi:putative FmdB family regulatory protein|nr:zinc ribbon domain-containing protein [Treponema sp.]